MNEYRPGTRRLVSMSLTTGLLLMTSSALPSNTSRTEAEGERLLTDFSATSPELGWYVVNDNVMGGRSDGDFVIADSRLRFTGRTNTNGGGFSSIRTAPLELDLSTHAGIRLRVMGDGRRYTWRLTTDARWRGQQLGYWAEFDTDDGAWTTIDIPFSRFVPRFRGMELGGPPLDPGKVTGMGLMIYDGRDGPFEIEISRAAAYQAEAPFTLEEFRWRKRVLVLSASRDDQPRLDAMRRQLASTTEAFSARDMVLVILLDDGPSTAGDRRLTAQEVAAARRAAGIQPGDFALRLVGKDGGVKLSSGDVIPIAEIYGRIDTMPMRQREMQGAGESEED